MRDFAKTQNNEGRRMSLVELVPTIVVLAIVALHIWV